MRVACWTRLDWTWAGATTVVEWSGRSLGHSLYFRFFRPKDWLGRWLAICRFKKRCNSLCDRLSLSESEWMEDESGFFL